MTKSRLVPLRPPPSVEPPEVLTNKYEYVINPLMGTLKRRAADHYTVIR